MNYLSICCFAKDEDEYIREFIAYHTLAGVEHFYIYDNESKRPLAEVLGDLDKDLVTVTPWPGVRTQLAAFQHCLVTHGRENMWIGFLDIDEFACPLQDNDLRVLLSEYENYGGLVAPWEVFAPVEIRRLGLSSEIFRDVFAKRDHKSDWHLKSFVRPERVQGFCTPHAFLYREGFFAVNEEHLPVTDIAFFYSPMRKLKINHYYFRSREEFEQKIARGTACADPSVRTIKLFNDAAPRQTIRDDSMERFLPGLKKQLKQGIRKPPAGLGDGAGMADYLDVIATSLETGKTEQAQVLLCHALSRFGDSHDISLMRAMAARLDKQYERAFGFLRRTLEKEASPLALKELALLRRDQGRAPESALLETYIMARADIRE